MGKTHFEHFFRPTMARIDLKALTHNYDALKNLLPEGVEIMAMVKADAYGHGAVEVSRALEQLGVKALGVATVEEGLELRSSGIETRILVMGGLMGVGSAAACVMVGADLTPVIHSADVIGALETAAREKKKKLPIHVKVDTGMNRLGIRIESLPNLLSRIKSSENLVVEGVMTHFAQAGHNSFTDEQIDLFKKAKVKIESELGKIRLWHMANSTALIERLISFSDMDEIWVRPGLSLYGTVSDAKVPDGVKLIPVMSLVSKVALIKHVPKGERVSYGSTFEVKKNSLLAVVPIGYADGYPWALSNKAKVLIEGMRVPVVGRVTMDMIIVDVTDLSGKVEVGSEVILMGRQKDASITVDEIASWANTIPYEIFCGISKRMPRIYI
ncbi:MAG: alanine racemase [Pseudomonadota bacterium]